MSNRRAKPDWVTKSPPLINRKAACLVQVAFLLRALLVGARSPLGGSPCPRRRPRPPQSYKTSLPFCMTGAAIQNSGCCMAGAARVRVCGALRACRRRARAARCARPARRAPRPAAGWRARARSRPALGDRRGCSAACGRRGRAPPPAPSARWLRPLTLAPLAIGQ